MMRAPPMIASSLRAEKLDTPMARTSPAPTSPSMARHVSASGGETSGPRLPVTLRRDGASHTGKAAGVPVGMGL